MQKKKQNKGNTKKILYYPYDDWKSAQKAFLALSQGKLLSTHEVSDKMLRSKSSFGHSRTLRYLDKLKDLGYCNLYRTIKAPIHHNCGFTKKSFSYIMDDDVLQHHIELIKESKEPFAGKIIEKGFITEKIPFQLYCKICKTNQLIKFDEKNYNKEFKISNYKYWSLTDNGALIALTVLSEKHLPKFLEMNSDLEIIKIVKYIWKVKKMYVDILIYDLKNRKLETNDLTKIANDWIERIQDKILKLKIPKKKHPDFIKFQSELKSKIQREKLVTNRHRL